MNQDSAIYDSLSTRPLPKWLTDQRDGLNTYQPEVFEMKDDNSLQISIVITGIIIVITVVVLTVYFFYRNKKRL
ncbi:MAG: hypothetical protein PHN68_08735 [Prolixibacteraceae bacterium]|jgi:heme/copper-type cytochrome/quinol oxidase subunit 2|nr:hypothetical protein [Prolixibacteraceae bacterium]MDD4755652.1 hypothetical protein [Prolixibacteraceae bacterium]NLO03624.1 hypothetical protein [Bacteroidales bacterium]